MHTPVRHHPQHGAEPSSTPSWSPPPHTPQRSLPLTGAWLCFHLVCCVCNETMCTPSCLVSFTAFLLSLSGFAWTLLLSVPHPPAHPESSVLPALPPPHPPCLGKVGLSQESQVVPLTARDPGRKLGREGWGKQPETKAQGSARRLLPGGAQALCRLGHKPRAGVGLTEASELSRG